MFLVVRVLISKFDMNTALDLSFINDSNSYKITELIDTDINMNFTFKSKQLIRALEHNFSINSNAKKKNYQGV